LSVMAKPPKTPGRAAQTVTRNLDFNAELYSLIKSEAGYAGKSIPDVIHERLCRGMDRSDLLPNVPSKLARESA